MKAGDYPLNLDLPVMVRVKEKGRRGGHNPFKDFFGDNSPFGDSFFDDFFGGTTEKPVTLHTDGATVHSHPAREWPSCELLRCRGRLRLERRRDDDRRQRGRSVHVEVKVNAGAST